MSFSILTTLEENCHVINLPQLYSSLIDQIMSVDSTELKQSLLKVSNCNYLCMNIIYKILFILFILYNLHTFIFVDFVHLSSDE